MLRNLTLFALLCMVLALGSPESSALGKSAGETPKPEAPKVGVLSSELGQLESFEVFTTEARDFSAFREDIPLEVVEYARTAIQGNTRLHYGSPAEGVLHFYCENNSCSRIRAEVTRGESGPVLWRTIRQYRPNPLVDIHFLPDSRRFSGEIVKQLAADYQAAQRTISVSSENAARIPAETRIQIPEN